MSIKHSPRKVTLAMIKGKPITTSVPVIHYHASDDELEEIYPSSEEEKRLTPELETSDSKVTSTLSKCVERRFAHESDVSENNSDTRSVSTENVLPEGTPPSLDPWKVFSEIKGKITKTFEEKLSEIKNDKKKRRHSKAESSSISDFEDQGFVISCDKKIEDKQLTDETMTTTTTTTTTTAIIGQHRRGNPVRYVGFSDVKTGLKDKSLQDECVESGIEASEFGQSVNEDVVCCTKNDSSTAKGSSRDDYACLQQQASTRSAAFPKRIDFKATFSHLMQQLIIQMTYKFVAIFIAIFSIYYVALLPEYVLGFIMGIFGTVGFYSALTKFKRLLTTLPDEKFVCSSIVPVLEIPAAKEHSVIERFQGWLNELPYNYEPSNYHVARTKSVFFRLEGNILRVMETRMKIPKKAVWDEAKHKLKFVRRRVYNLTGARIELVPYGLTRRRRWSKKYPICITVKKGALICNVTLKNSANDECAINDYYRKTPSAKVRVKYRSDKKVVSSWEEENHEGDETCFIDGEPDESVTKQNRRREENKDAVANDSYSIYDPNNDNVVKSSGSWREQRQKEIDITSRNVRRSDYSCIDRRGKQTGKGANVGMEKNEKEQDGKKEIRKGMKEVGPEEVPRVIQQRKGFPFGKDLNEEECRKGDKEGVKKTVLMADRVGNEEKEAGENDEEEEEKDEEDEEEEEEDEDEDYDELDGKYGELGMGEEEGEEEEMRDDEDDDDYDYDYDYDDDGDDDDDDDDDDNDDDVDDDNVDEDEDEDEDKDVVVVVVNDNDNDDNRNHSDNNEVYEVEGKKEKQQEKKKEEEKLTDKDVGKEKIAVGGVEQRNVKKTDRKVADNDDNCDGSGVDRLGKRSDRKVKLLNLKSTLKKSKKKPNQRNELKIFVFARADREKEDWFRRLVSAASLSEKKKRGDSLSFIVDGSYMSNVSLTGQKNATTESKGCLSASSSDEKSTAELNYNAYMGKYLDAGCSSTLEKSCSTGTEDTLWINCLIARLLFDIHKCPETINLIQDKIQRKLSSIKLPYFMECLLVSEVTIGQGAPVIRSITKPMFNERGIWLDFDVTYKGSLTMTVETKLNLMKLTRTGSIPSNNSNVLIPSEKHESIVRSPIFDSDLEDTPETSTEDEDTSRTQLYNTAKETTGTQSSGKKFLSMVDRIAANKYFQHATELSYVRRAMEGVSNTEIRLMVTVSSIEGCLSVNIPPAPADRLWYGFKPVPKVALTVKPALGERMVNIVYVTKWIEAKLLREFEKLVVLPNMDDLVVPLCPNYPYTTTR